MNKSNEKTSGKILLGIVKKIGINKTVTVTVERFWKHPLYKKSLRRNHHFLVHNEKTDLKIGDKVKIQESKPISKLKHFKILEKII